jgi:hypothetical protein
LHHDKSQEEFRNANSFSGHLFGARDYIYLWRARDRAKQKTLQACEDRGFHPNA